MEEDVREIYTDLKFDEWRNEKLYQQFYKEWKKKINKIIKDNQKQGISGWGNHEVIKNLYIKWLENQTTIGRINKSLDKERRDG
jgi:Txe/YoeB family toxin of Txe-Axe toxin-antitoxin module